MSEIEIGEYVRSIYGEIKRVDYIFKNNKTSGIDEYGQEISKDNDEIKGYTVVKANEVVKHSKNIEDLIEVGDIVVLKEDNRKYEILSIEKATNKNEIIVCIFKHPNNCELYTTLTKDKIKTILTHEQYENNCYRVEEDKLC